jgi:biotin operon repressor
VLEFGKYGRHGDHARHDDGRADVALALYRAKGSDPCCPHSALRLLSGPNHDLIKRIAAGKFSSLAELAAQSGRAESNLNRTLKKLERLGLVIMQPGTGRTLKPVLAVRSLRVELDLVEGTARRLDAATTRAPRKTVAKPNGVKPRGQTRATVHN